MKKYLAGTGLTALCPSCGDEKLIELFNYHPFTDPLPFWQNWCKQCEGEKLPAIEREIKRIYGHFRRENRVREAQGLPTSTGDGRITVNKTSGVGMTEIAPALLENMGRVR
jgi:hypothetical protein